MCPSARVKVRLMIKSIRQVKPKGLCILGKFVLLLNLTNKRDQSTEIQYHDHTG